MLKFSFNQPDFLELQQAGPGPPEESRRITEAVIYRPRSLPLTKPTVSNHDRQPKVPTPTRKKDQLSLTNPRDVLHHGEHAGRCLV